MVPDYYDEVKPKHKRTMTELQVALWHRNMSLRELAAQAQICLGTAWRAARGMRLTERTRTKIEKALGCRIEAELTNIERQRIEEAEEHG